MRNPRDGRSRTASGHAGGEGQQKATPPTRLFIRKAAPRRAQSPPATSSDDAPPGRWLYLHDFGSSPASRKARFFQQRCDLAGLPLAVPDLNVPSFAEITVAAMLERIDEVVADGPPGSTVGLIGSGLGGLMALLSAGRHESVRRLLLLAPATSLFRRHFLGIGRAGVRRWEQVGYHEFHHFATGGAIRVGSAFVRDARTYDENRLGLGVPVTIVHGTRDVTVDPHLSVLYARAHRRYTTLHLVDDDHSLLTSCAQIWDWLWRDIRPRRGSGM